MESNSLPDLLYWDLQWQGLGIYYPRDTDFYTTEYCYWDLELLGEIWDNFCNPDAVIRGQIFSTNDGNELPFINWRAPKWIPNPDGVIPQNFVAKHYRVIIYDNPHRNGEPKIITGDIEINNAYLIDKQGWFVSKILNVTPNQKTGIGESLQLFCEILQPSVSHLIITIQKDEQLPIKILDERIWDQTRIKILSTNYLFNDWGNYLVKYYLKTYKGNYINNWCPPSEDYLEISQTVIQVGDI